MEADDAAMEETGTEPALASVDEKVVEAAVEEVPVVLVAPVAGSLETPSSSAMEVDGSVDGPARKRGLSDDAPLSGRQKRQKSVKFSPSKAVEGRARRVVATQASSQARAQMIALGMAVDTESVPNNDFCEACGGKGHFLCCDGCPRSFHFACLEPPLQLDELPSESWFCKACEAAKAPRPAETPADHKGLFGPLIAKAEESNVKQFKLPETVKSYFKDVSQTSAGEFVDLDTLKTNKLNKGSMPDERDPWKTRDKSGRPILCFKCGETASQPAFRKIVGCDFCDQHWHLDCLDPPLAGMPPTSRRWRCPLHSEEVAKKKRQPKSQITLPQTQRNMPNNGLIDIIPRRSRGKGVPDYDESVVNGVRYQIPEETIILDFWDKINGIRSVPPVRLAKSGKIRHAGAPASDISSPLSSPPSSPEPGEQPLPPLGHSAAPLRRDASEALSDDRVVLDVNGLASPLPEHERTVSPSSMADSRMSSPVPSLHAQLEHSASQLPTGDEASEPAVNGLAPPVGRRGRSAAPGGTSTAPASANASLKVKLNVAGKKRDASPGSGPFGRGRASLPAGPIASTSATRLDDKPTVKLSAPPPGKRANGAPSGLRQSMTVDASGGEGSPETSFEKQERRRPVANRTMSTSSSAIASELAVQSKEDLKALSHVRKMLKNEAYSGQKGSVLDFLGAESPSIVPKLAFLGNAESQPWTLPWADDVKPETPKAVEATMQQ